jgi:predicted lipoprotein with Yx(FWY)xxD motif
MVSTAQAGALGTILVDHSGFTLYRFSPDGTGKTTCTGACAATWPPLTVPTTQVTGGAGIINSELGTITRPDGSLQATFNGMPLYHFRGDKKAGDTMGQGVASEWFVVPASASAATAPSTSSTAPPPPSTSSTTPAAVNHSTAPGMSSGGTVTPPTPASVTPPPVTAPPATSPPATSPPVTSPPTTSGGGYGY